MTFDTIELVMKFDTYPWYMCDTHTHTLKTHSASRIHIQPIPRGVTFSRALSKLKAQSSNVSFHWNVAKETFELWALSFELWQHYLKTSPQVGSAVYMFTLNHLVSLSRSLSLSLSFFLAPPLSVYLSVCLWRSLSLPLPVFSLPSLCPSLSPFLPLSAHTCAWNVAQRIVCY